MRGAPEEGAPEEGAPEEGALEEGTPEKRTPEISLRLKNRLIAAAKAKAPEECCGLIWQAGSGWHFEELENTAADKVNFFEIDSAAILAQSDRQNLAVFHSHPTGPAFPSYDDMVQQQACQIPYLILSLAPMSLFWLGQADAYPLAAGHGYHARPYRHGVTDCYALIRDWYEAKKGVLLADYPRHWSWWHQGGDMYEQHFAETGFYEFDPQSDPQNGPQNALQAGDVFLARIRSPVCNHAGIYLGQGLILHHPASQAGFDPGRAPQTEPVLRWHRFIDKWLRLKGAEDG